MKKIITLGVLAAFTIVLISCGSTAKVQKDDTANLKEIKTFAWSNQQTKSQAITELTDRNIKAFIKERLEKIGLTEAKNRNADVLLTYDVLLEKSTQEQSNAVYSQPYTSWYYSPRTRRYFPVTYPSQFVGYNNTTRTIKEGTLTLTLISNSTEKVIWQGWATDDVGKRITADDVEPSVKAVVKKLEKDIR
jgi:Domain of unknown function (DUF4136)